jgi:ADP-ribose pyrophosphatase YjhB (NUDIX family)
MNQAEAAELRQLADELRAIAGFGLNFARNPHDAERYNHVLGVAARLGALIEGESAEELLARYRANHFDIGPLASGEAVVVHDNRLLLVRRSDDGLWALPGGITDPGETLAESASRELYEETGICGRITALMGLFDSRLWHSEKKIHFYHAVFRFEADDYTLRPNDEIMVAQFFAEDELPPLSPGHHLRAPFVFRQLRGEVPLPYFDPPLRGCAGE